MSAPDTNTEKQAKQHRPALWGMWGGLIAVAILLLIFVGWLFIQTDGPEGAETQVESGVGTEATD